MTRIYDRAELLPERRSALVAWAAWLEPLKTEERKAKGAAVVPIKRRRR